MGQHSEDTDTPLHDHHCGPSPKTYGYTTDHLLDSGGYSPTGRLPHTPILRALVVPLSPCYCYLRLHTLPAVTTRCRPTLHTTYVRHITTSASTSSSPPTTTPPLLHRRTPHAATRTCGPRLWALHYRGVPHRSAHIATGVRTAGRTFPTRIPYLGRRELTLLPERSRPTTPPFTTFTTYSAIHASAACQPAEHSQPPSAHSSGCLLRRAAHSPTFPTPPHDGPTGW